MYKGNVIVVNHPMVQHKLTILRDKKTGSKEFRELVKEIGMFMVYETTRDLPMQEIEIDTPICKTKSKVLAGKKLGVVPILRAGLGMMEGVLQLIPAAKVEYYCKLPQDVEERELLLVDPMLATGGSASAAIELLKQKGAKSIKLVCIVGCPEGIEEVHKYHPEIDIYLASIDEKLNDHGYIVPGLGDAGDRIFGTK